MLSNWVLVAINDDTNANGCYHIHSEPVKFTVTDGNITESLYGWHVLD